MVNGVRQKMEKSNMTAKNLISANFTTTQSKYYTKISEIEPVSHCLGFPTNTASRHVQRRIIVNFQIQRINEATSFTFIPLFCIPTVLIFIMSLNAMSIINVKIQRLGGALIIDGPSTAFRIFGVVLFQVQTASQLESLDQKHD